MITGRVRALGARIRHVAVFAAITGAITGLGVAAFDRIVQEGVLDRVLDLPLWVQAAAPAGGLAAAALILRWIGRGESPSTADEYIKEFHDPNHRLDEREAPAKLLASGATLGLGAAMGFEGPSIYLGAVVGSWIRKRLARGVASIDANTLMVCGAAAGVAAIFKAPATGVVFALEVPYRQDLARHMLLPAMFYRGQRVTSYSSPSTARPLCSR